MFAMTGVVAIDAFLSQAYVFAIAFTIAAPFLLFYSSNHMKDMLEELKEASERFEAKEAVHSVGLENYARLVKHYRPAVNLTVLFIVYNVHEMYVEGVDVIGILLNLFWVALIFEFHLLDVDDINPEDREYLFDPDKDKVRDDT